MAGKLHKDYGPYLAGTGQELVPGSKMVKAYAHGYGDQRRGVLQAGNPYPEPVGNVDNNARAWDQGWRDANAGNPPTHVGGATGVPRVEEEPEEEESVFEHEPPLRVWGEATFKDEPRAVRPRRPSRATEPEDDD
jgi:hypothetical protein